MRRRPALIQSALCSPDLGECFTYPEHVLNLSKKILGALKVKTSKGLEGTWKGKSSLDQPDSTENILRVFGSFDFESP